MTPPQKVSYGLYTVQEGQGAMDIAQAVYGDPKRLTWVLDANPESDFAPGDKVVIPNKKGTLITAQAGDYGVAGPFLRDMPGRALQQYISLITKWNGGDDLDILPGDVIFVPDRQTNGY
jgi:hypothetical protein